MNRFITLGAMIYDMRVIPYADEKILNRPCRLRGTAGGVARNAAEKLAHMGRDAALISACGFDMTGRILLEDAQKKGIDTTYVKQMPLDKTPSLLIVCDAHNQVVESMLDHGVLTSIDHLYLYSTLREFGQEEILIADNNLSLDQLRFVASQHPNTWLLPVHDKCILPYERLLPQIEGIQLNMRMLFEDWQFNIYDEDSLLAAVECLKSKGIQRMLLALNEEGVVYADQHTLIHLNSPYCQKIVQDNAQEILLCAFLTKLIQHAPANRALEYALTALLLEKDKEHEKEFLLSEENVIDNMNRFGIHTVKEVVYD